MALESLACLPCVLQAIGEPLECKYYNTWNVLVPEGTFLTQVGLAVGTRSCLSIPVPGFFVLLEP